MIKRENQEFLFNRLNIDATKYTKEQLEILSYADKMYVSLSGMTVKKTLAIRERLSDI